MNRRMFSLLITLGISAAALGQPAETPASPPSGDYTLPTMPAPPGIPQPPPMMTPDANATPVPPSGDRPGFSYAPSGNHEGVSVVYPTGGEPVIVATDFLEASLRASTTDEQVLQDVQRFEQMNDRVAEQYAKEFFPDKNAPKVDVPATTVEGADRNVSIEPDPQAGPYVRVKVTDKDGNLVSEHSVSATMAQKTLNNPNLDAEGKIASLTRADFQLPEQARARFNDLSSEELLTMAAEKPELRNKNIFRMKRVLAEEKARRSAAGPSTATQSRRTPVPSMAAPKRAKDDLSAEKSAPEPSREPATDANREKAAAAAAARKAPTGLELPEIVGIILALGAVGVFVYGLWKTRRG